MNANPRKDILANEPSTYGPFWLRSKLESAAAPMEESKQYECRNMTADNAESQRQDCCS